MYNITLHGQEQSILNVNQTNIGTISGEIAERQDGACMRYFTCYEAILSRTMNQQFSEHYACDREF